jgi:RNA polymerase sigma-70 factor (ECF subfamily)
VIEEKGMATMDNREFLAQRFEENRGHLRAVAYRMLGSATEADDAVQEAWLRLNRSDATTIENLGGWLTTVVGRVCLDMLRARTSRREEALDTDVNEPVAKQESGSDPEQEAVLADSVGLALLVVLDRLSPAERLAFVLHDLFGVSFEEVGEIVGRTPAAARQLASRARRRVRGADKIPDEGLSPQREVVDAFLAALRAGDFEGLVAVLDPDVEVRIDEAAARPGGPREIHGARAWAKGAIAFSQAAAGARLALVDGKLGLVLAQDGQLFRALQFTFANGKIAHVEIIGDPTHLREMEMAVLE